MNPKIIVSSVNTLASLRSPIRDVIDQKKGDVHATINEPNQAKHVAEILAKLTTAAQSGIEKVIILLLNDGKTPDLTQELLKDLHACKDQSPSSIFIAKDLRSVIATERSPSNHAARPFQIQGTIYHDMITVQDLSYADQASILGWIDAVTEYQFGPAD